MKRTRARLLPRPTVGVAAALGASCLLAWSVLAADTERTTIALDWTVAPEAACAGREIVVREIAAELGYDPFGPAPKLTLAGRVWRDGDRFFGTIRRVGGAGEKAESSTDCRELARLLAFDIALLVSPPLAPVGAPDAGPADAAPAIADAAPLGADAAPAPSQAPPVARIAPPPAADRVTPAPAPLALRVGASTLGVWSPAERLHLGIAGEVGVRWPSVSLNLEARAVLPRSGEGVGSDDMDASMLLATAYPCIHRGVVLLCGAVSAGTLTLERREAERTGFYAAGGARAGVEIPLGHGLSGGLRGDILFGGRPVVCADAVEDDTCDVPTASTWTGSIFSGSLGAALLADF